MKRRLSARMCSVVRVWVYSWSKLPHSLFLVTRVIPGYSPVTCALRLESEWSYSQQPLFPVYAKEGGWLLHRFLFASTFFNSSLQHLVNIESQNSPNVKQLTLAGWKSHRLYHRHPMTPPTNALCPHQRPLLCPRPSSLSSHISAPTFPSSF